MPIRELEKGLYEYRLWVSHSECFHESFGEIFMFVFDLLTSDKSKTVKRRLLPETILLGIQIFISPLASSESIQEPVQCHV